MKPGPFAESAPQEIHEFHRALLVALNLDHFPAGMSDVNSWGDFLAVMKPLAESVGGPFVVRDIHAAVRLMRQQNKSGEARWSLRYSKILREPEAFRDLVLIARKEKRPRAAKVADTAKTGDGANVAIELDPAAESEARPVSESVRAFMNELEERKKARASK
jgi:hypothetical protein